ncbi:MAG: class I SAM-dependent methyltransferase [Mariniphaga sp.]|nr:class I SAM-dependent methyltransferase [Mariniphaga sp.]
MEQLKKYFNKKSVYQILDIATGEGQFIKILMDIFPDASYTGIDPNEESLQIAKETFQDKNIQFFKMRAEKLDFENEKFDLVSISNGLHHLPHLETSLSEMKRVLKPDDLIIINELVSNNLTPAQENQKFYHHLKSYTDRLSGHFHHETWAKQKILDIIQQNGIQIEISFDYFDGKNFITETENIDFWVIRLKEHLEVLKDRSVYQELLPKVKEFRRRIEKDGMEHATNVVVVGKI